MFRKLRGLLSKYKRNIVRASNFLFRDCDKLVNDITDIKFCQGIIMDYVFDVRNVRPASGGMREFQLKDVELLKIFKDVCDKNHIGYWLCFGSLLGAFRHGGFVPWDNDLDIGMLKDDFDRLKLLAPEFRRRGVDIIDYWVPGAMSRIVFQGIGGPFVDIYAFSEEKDVISPLPPWGTSVRYGLPLPKSFILPLKKESIVFEGVKANAPNQVENCLRFYYGDYMKFPKHCHSAAGHFSIDPYSFEFASKV